MKGEIVMKVNESLFVGVDFTNSEDTGVLIVGRKRPNESVEIIKKNSLLLLKNTI